MPIIGIYASAISGNLGLSVDYLVVAGGGGGGRESYNNGSGGGGGAGGLRSTVDNTGGGGTLESKLTLNPNAVSVLVVLLQIEFAFSDGKFTYKGIIS